jgi:hypothetical protein
VSVWRFVWDSIVWCSDLQCHVFLREGDLKCLCQHRSRVFYGSSEVRGVLLFRRMAMNGELFM